MLKVKESDVGTEGQLKQNMKTFGFVMEAFFSTRLLLIAGEIS